MTKYKPYFSFLINTKMFNQFVTGFNNSFKFDIIYQKIFQYKKVRVSLIKSFGFNILTICNWFIIYYLTINYVVDPKSVMLKYTIIYGYYVFILSPLIVLSLVLNNMWRLQIAKVILEKNLAKQRRSSISSNIHLKQSKLSTNAVGNISIDDKIGIARKKSGKDKINMIPTQLIYSFIHDNISMLIFYICNWIVISILNKLLPIIFSYILYEPYMTIFSYVLLVCEIAFSSLLCSAYSLEYLLRYGMQNSPRLLVSRLEYTEQRAIYLIGFGIFITSLGYILPNIIYWGLSEFLLTNLLVISMYTKHIKTDHPIDIFYIQKKILPTLTNNILKYILKYVGKYD